MLRNYLKIAVRSLWRNKAYSTINVAGLALGMAVTLLIGLWVWDELTFDKTTATYDRLGKVFMYQTFSGQRGPQDALPLALAAELRANFPDLQQTAMTSWDDECVLTYKDRMVAKRGTAAEPQFTRMLALPMLSGTQDGLRNVNSVILSDKLASALFGTENPVGKVVRFNSGDYLTVTGVYQHFPANSSFATIDFFYPMAYYTAHNDWTKRAITEWDNNSFPCYVLLTEQAQFDAVSAKIKQVVRAKRGAEATAFQPELTISPMRNWYLHGLMDKARGGAGRIQFVRLFGLVGVFILLLACINFINLSTARSEKRAKEVGIRKAIGSKRGQLVGQFLSESGLVVMLAFGLAIGLVALSLPGFNQLADKALVFPWDSGSFWLVCVGFITLTILLAGGYPALYLSGFNPINVLKGGINRLSGRWTATPRRVLVVVQFTVSVSLIIGTTVVYRQIQHAKSRPIGYDRAGLIYTFMNTPELRGDYNRLRADLLLSGGAINMTESRSPMTEVGSNTNGFGWPGKSPSESSIIGRLGVTHDYGQTIGFQLVSGRDFSRSYATDSSAVILNESAVRKMGLKKPVGTLVTHSDRTYQVVGVIKDMLMQSPYDPVMPTVFMLSYDWVSTITIRLNPALSPTEAIASVETVFRKHNPNAPFDYKFVDDTFAQKFRSETRIGQLALLGTLLAIIISCLGLYGMALFTAEQRTKEIGIRKVLGASLLSLWGLLSKEAIGLVLIAFAVAVPLTYSLTSDWLQTYTYRTTLPWWLFALAGLGALLITLLTTSYQTIRAALMNPVNALKSE